MCWKLMAVVCLSYLVTDCIWNEEQICWPYPFCEGSMGYVCLDTSLHTEIWNKRIWIVYYDIVYTVVTPASVLLLQFHSLP